VKKKGKAHLPRSKEAKVGGGKNAPFDNRWGLTFEPKTGPEEEGKRGQGSRSAPRQEQSVDYGKKRLHASEQQEK